MNMYKKSVKKFGWCIETVYSIIEYYACEYKPKYSIIESNISSRIL